MAKRLVGIYGGTFSPPHLGHISSAESFKKFVMLDELLIMPSFLPPHKEIDDGATTQHRLEMCRLAFSDIEGVTVSEHEILRGGKSYTAITLTELSSDDVELYFLCGTDMLLTLDTWYEFKTIFRLATICYVRRESDRELTSLIEKRVEEYRQKYGARVIAVPNEVVEISSSELRSLIKCGSPTGEYLLPTVSSYIKERGLYR